MDGISIRLKQWIAKRIRTSNKYEYIINTLIDELLETAIDLPCQANKEAILEYVEKKWQQFNKP